LKPYYKHIKYYCLYKLIIVFALLQLFSCRPTKYVPDNEYLLKKNEIEFEEKTTKKTLKKDELEKHIRQKPNKKILGLKFHLWLYNLSNIDKDNKFNKLLRKLGEPPVIYDKYTKNKTEKRLTQYLRNKGYHLAEVDDSVRFKNKKAFVMYKIQANEPYRINDIKYTFEDTTLQTVVFSDTTNSLLQKGERFDVDYLKNERIRIESLLKNKGYYNFSREYIHFQVDSTVGDKQVNINVNIKKFTTKNKNNQIITIKHPTYTIRNIYVHANYDPQQALSDKEKYHSKLDTTIIDNFFYITDTTHPVKIKPKTVLNTIYIENGALYSYKDVQQTYNHLSSLRLFKLINIKFIEKDIPTGDKNPELDCNIQLSPHLYQSYNLEVEGTNASGDIGIAGNVLYQHKNLFNGAEILDIRVRSAIEALKEREINQYSNTLQYGSDIRIRLPRFLLPLKREAFIKKYNPKTDLSMAYNYQRRPDYTRAIANASFGYNWKGNKYNSHMINPVELNYVNLIDTSQIFWNEIDPFLKNSYQDHLIGNTSYRFVFNTQEVEDNTDFVFVRFNTEIAGNILSAAYNLTGQQKEDGSYSLFGIKYAQYIRTDIDLRYYQVLNESDKIVYRIFSGLGYPYNNSNVMPFEKKYFSGGANSIRAWQVRTLGPGSYKEESKYPNSMGDIKLEANIEYRFALIWLIEGALFVDAGNIWAINKDDSRGGAFFKTNQFYKDIAIGTGFGMRFDFSFFIFRLDIGLKARDPANPAGEKWIPGNQKINSEHINLNIGIGYPF
jgi:outer membrane protein assembly factor BamA